MNQQICVYIYTYIHIHALPHVFFSISTIARHLKSPPFLLNDRVCRQLAWPKRPSEIQIPGYQQTPQLSSNVRSLRYFETQSNRLYHFTAPDVLVQANALASRRLMEFDLRCTVLGLKRSCLTPRLLSFGSPVSGCHIFRPSMAALKEPALTPS